MRFSDGGVDVIQATFTWVRPLHPASFAAAWRNVARRHPVLATVFRLDDADGLLQATFPAAPLDIRWRDLPRPPACEADQPLELFLREDRRERFDLTGGPLVRLTILRTTAPAGRPVPGRPGADATAAAVVDRAVLTFHHALLDGHSLRLLVDEVTVAYVAILDGRVPLAPRRPSFRDFARWLGEADSSVAKQFWTDYLTGIAVPRPLPGYLGGPATGTGESVSAQTVLSRADSDLIRQSASAAGLTSSAMITAAWALLRARYGSVSDVVLAVTRSLRRDGFPSADAVIGPLINTVPLRVRVDEDATVRTLVTTVSDGIRQVRPHQRTPMASVLSWGGLPADTTLMDTLVMFDRRRLQTQLQGGDSAPASARVDRLPSYPLTLCAFDEPQIHLSLVWDRSRFADGAAARMLSQLRDTLIEMASKASVPLADLDLGRTSEAGTIAEWNRTGRPYPVDATIGTLFAAQVARAPDATALAFDGGSVTYAELDRRSSALAWSLRGRGVVAGTPVGIAMKRGADLIVSLLAVLKAGGAYLPVDAGSPASRVTAIIAATGARLVLATPETAAALPPMAGVEIVHRSLEVGDEAGQVAPPPADCQPLSLAYISFTSGSTGVPKGVEVPHRAVIRLISDPTFGTLGPGDRILQMAPVAFDASTLEIWGALLTGATIVIAPPGPLGLPDIGRLLRDAGVTVAWLTAGLFHQLAEADTGALADVRLLLAGGDVLNPDLVRAVLAARRGKPLVNGYGPTENTTFTTCHVMTDPGQVGLTVPIGRPIQHTTVHVLDPSGRPAPIGMTGELYAGGDGLARGYTGNAAATARAFVPDPSGSGTRLYRTGDLARWRADGILEFVGRADDQVKIRGFRVEPGEVETVLRAHPGVREAVVIAAGAGAQRHLIGYVTPTDGADPHALRPSGLRDFVAARLPDYLVPTAFKALARFPLNANGKVDRAALPAPERESHGLVTSPHGPTERRLADIWRRLLAADGDRDGDVSREDSFFALGGNSLSAARLMFRIREAFGVELSLTTFYEAPTLTASATAIDAARGGAVPPGGGPAPATGSSAAVRPGIGRRDRSGYRVDSTRSAAALSPALAPGPKLAPHLVPLTDDWALWRTICLRGAGLPIGLVSSLGDPALARAADTALAADPDLAVSVPTAPRAGSADDKPNPASAAYAAEFTAATGRLSAALHEAACLPALREAVAWQNRHALTTGIDPLVRRGPRPPKRNGQHRQHEALVASYLQRYCVKNDTIGFFGPVGWSLFDDGPAIRIEHDRAGGLLAARITYLEGWAVRAVMTPHLAALRPWLVPRRMPFVGLDGMQLRLPLSPPMPLTPAEVAIMRSIDGVKDAREVAAAVLGDPAAGLGDEAEVFALIARLADSHRLAWQVDVAPQDTRPERSVRALLARVTDATVRLPAEQAISELSAARDELAGAAGDAGRVAAAMAGLEETFTRLAGAPPTRRAGATYAGRTLAYEECLRSDTVRLGPDALNGIRAALALVLDSARWFTARCATLYETHFEAAYRQRAAALGTNVVPFTDFWLLVNDVLFDESQQLIQPAVRELRERWSAVWDLPPGARQARRRAADLQDAVTAQFPLRPRPWPMAVHHSPDLMIASADAATGGSLTWVLGEIHNSVVTTRYATWMEFQDDPRAVAGHLRDDLGGSAVWFAESGEIGGTNTRLSNILTSPGDFRLVYAHDSCGYDPATALTIGDCDLIATPAGLRVRRRDGAAEHPLLDVLGDLIATMISHHFSLAPPVPGGHAPRVTIDDLVVSRERWTFAATEPAFTAITDESARYLQARAWAARHGMPRHIFLRVTGERKPIYADLTSLASIDLISRTLRRSRRSADADADATVTVTEMVPTQDQAWLTDADGQRYAAELRIVAVDQRADDQAAAFNRPEG